MRGGVAGVLADEAGPGRDRQRGAMLLGAREPLWKTYAPDDAGSPIITGVPMIPPPGPVAPAAVSMILRM
ncbi:hypothetical protein [Streptomyces sp. NPDC001903]|uniref:hypothetical protein n=1 Tax=Streptomyces sp. NPDC001903 TaxID=3364622 RepID=UPI0036874219